MNYDEEYIRKYKESKEVLELTKKFAIQANEFIRKLKTILKLKNLKNNN